jgi:hypothetical protein
MTKELSLKENCKHYLEKRWEFINQLFAQEQLKEPLNDDFIMLKEKIRDCITSNTKSYRYVLPTQLLSKSVNHSLDCRSLQVADESEGSFDARSIAHQVVVPFETENHNVLGGSKEPYVNNPLRCPAISLVYRERQRNKDDWNKLIFVLDMVQNKNDETFTKNVFDQVFFEIHKLLADVKVIYPTPNRISLELTINLIKSFLAEKSGGDRLEVVATSLFRTISEKFKLFDEVKREKVNVADASSGMVADIECYLKGEIVLLVEVKDRSLNLTQLNAKVDLARANQIKEVLFMAQKGVDDKNRSEIHRKISQEFTSGQNIYISDLLKFAEGILILLGEKGRVDFLNKIGIELDSSKSAIQHRKAWANLLREI